jgi:hypothetical protein
VIRNDGNTPLNGDITATLLDKEGVERQDWSVAIEPSTVSGLAVGATLEVAVTLLPLDDVERGASQLMINLTTSEGQTSTLEQVVSVEIAEGSTGLFNILPAPVSGAIVAALLIGGLVLARRMKKTGELEDDSTALVAPNTHANPDMLGERRDEALDLGSAVDELTSGEVSDEEIAQAIMQSMDLPAIPAAVPKGLPPSGMPPASLPKGLPPAGMPPTPSKSLPSLPTPAVPQPAPAVASVPAPAVNQGPPLPPGGLPPGWTMEQWQHYGQEWINRQG